MTRMPWLLWLSLSLAACASCATFRRASSNEVAGRAFKSSLSVLLEHRAELALTPEQVDRFEKMDFTLHEKNQPLQQQLDTLRAQNKKNNRPWNGGYQGGGVHDVHGGKGGDLSAPPEEAQEKRLRRERLERMGSTLRAMQDNDSQAYVDAEKVLTDAQKPRARELFSQEREGLLKQLDAMHFQLRKEDY